MKEFRSIEEVDAAGLPDDVSRVVRGTLTDLMAAHSDSGGAYNPDEDGHTVLIEAGDTDDAIRAAIGGHTLRDAPFEGCWRAGGCILACVMFNNQFGVTVVVRADGLPPEVRARMERDM